MGINIVLPNVSSQPYTHLAFEEYAKVKGKGNEYNDCILRAFFQEEQDIGNIDVLTKLAGEIGLDEKEYRTALENRTYREEHQKALQHAYNEADITAVPTFIIGDTVVAGIRSKENQEWHVELMVLGFPLFQKTMLHGVSREQNSARRHPNYEKITGCNGKKVHE